MSIPQELDSLKGFRQWVVYKLEPNEKKGKPDKMPYDPKTGRRAKANDPDTWGDYQAAATALETGKYHGLGFEFANGIMGVDLDNVRNPDTGQLTPEAVEIIKQLDSYTEISPSGTGVHILCQGEVPNGKGRRTKLKSQGEIEMYSQGRFFTVTGKPVEAPKPVQERTEQVKGIHRAYMITEAPQKAQEAPRTAQQPLTLSDTEIITKATQAANGPVFTALWHGDTSSVEGDHSRADFRLCSHLAYWTNGNTDAMDRLFRQSALYRPKWDNIHDPTHGRTYGQMTIDAVMADFVPYTGKEKTAPGGQTPETETKGSPNKETPQETVYLSPETLKSNLASEYLEQNFITDIERYSKYKNRKTGFYNLDNKINGIKPGLYVIGAISSLGKTTFIHQMADQMAEKNGDHVLFFSLEQNKLEMISKSLSRETAKIDPQRAVTSIEIRGGRFTDIVGEAQEKYSRIADKVSIIQCSFRTNVEEIMNYVKAYIAAFDVRPVVIVDYLQIIPPTDPRQSDKEKVDNIVRGLKLLQSDNDLVVIVVSSINRANYLNPIDFESFKESGGIEYTADVVWGLQLQCLTRSDLFNDEKRIKEKRDMIREEKKAIPRKIELLCLKNRYGISSYSIGFEYDPRYDLFTPDLEFDYGESYREEYTKKSVVLAEMVKSGKRV